MLEISIVKLKFSAKFKIKELWFIRFCKSYICWKAIQRLIKKQIHIIIILVENFFLLNYYSYDFLIQVKVTCRYHNYRFLQQNNILFKKKSSSHCINILYIRLQAKVQSLLRSQNELKSQTKMSKYIILEIEAIQWKTSRINKVISSSFLKVKTAQRDL